MELESGRDLSKTWLHVDMDAFYAAVAILENPLLKGKPMAVGSMSMISTANYEVWKTSCKFQEDNILEYPFEFFMLFWALSDWLSLQFSLKIKTATIILFSCFNA